MKMKKYSVDASTIRMDITNTDHQLGRSKIFDDIQRRLDPQRVGPILDRIYAEQDAKAEAYAAKMAKVQALFDAMAARVGIA
jgi:hypothetical protein